MEIEKEATNDRTSKRNLKLCWEGKVKKEVKEEEELRDWNYVGSVRREEN